MNTNKLKLPTLIAAAVCAAPMLVQAGETSDRFSQPVELLANGKPIDVPYPSPTFYDLDGDGKRELVVGDLRGDIFSAQKTNGDVTNWGDIVPVNTADGEILKLFNW